MPINITQLNKFVRLIEDNKLRIDRIPGVVGDDNYKFTKAVSVSILQEYYKLNFKEAYAAVCDGNGDCKIDALYYSDDTENLAELVLIQSKYKNDAGAPGTFTEDDIRILTANAISILRGRDLENPNQAVKEKLEQYRTLLQENDNPSIKIVIFLATNGVIHEDHKRLQCIADAKAQNISFVFADANAFGCEPQETSGTLKINIKSQDDKTDAVFVREGASMRGVLVSCSLKNYLAFYRAAGERQLFNQNIRYLLKRSKINSQILECFKTAPEDFCFYNNGISIVCSDYGIAPTGDSMFNLTLTHASIVNGGQTTGIIAELVEGAPGVYEEQLAKASVVLRVFKATPEQASKIAEATNAQNPIDLVNLKANHAVQGKVKLYLAERGVGLIVKDGEEILYYSDIITNENLLQIYAAVYGNDPAKAKVSKLAVFKKYFDVVFTEEAFQSNIAGKLYRCYQLSKYLYAKKETEDNQFITNAWYALLYTMKSRSPQVLNLDIPEAGLTVVLDAAYDGAKTILQRIVAAKQTQLHERFSMNNLFKNSEIKDLIDVEP
jgi:hypothetical protein